MHTLNHLISILLLAMMAYIVVETYLQYRKESALSGWARWRATASDSATMLWGKFCLAVGGLVGSLDSLADFAGAPELKDFINTWVGNPKAIAAIFLVIAGISMRSRMRSLPPSSQ